MAEPITLARPFARAAYYFAKENKAVSAWYDSLNTLTVVFENSTVLDYLKRVDIVPETKVATLLTLLSSPPSKFKNFLSILAQNKRLLLLPSIHVAFHRYKQLSEQEIDVVITSAKSIEEKQYRSLLAAISKKIDKKLQIVTEENADLIGGCIVKIGDIVVDNSILGRLKKLELIL